MCNLGKAGALIVLSPIIGVTICLVCIGFGVYIIYSVIEEKVSERRDGNNHI